MVRNSTDHGARVHARVARVGRVAYTACRIPAKNEPMTGIAPLPGRPPRALWRAVLFAAGLALTATAQGDAIRREFYFQTIGI